MRNSVIVSLTPLSDDETRTLLESILPQRHGPRRLRADRRAGRRQPAVRRGVRPDAAGSVRAVSRSARDVAVLAGLVPESLDALIAARLDTLGRRGEVAPAGRVGDRARLLAVGGGRGFGFGSAERPGRPPRTGPARARPTFQDLLRAGRRRVRLRARADPRRRLRPDPAARQAWTSMSWRPDGSSAWRSSASPTTPNCSPTTTGRPSTSAGRRGASTWTSWRRRPDAR